MTFITKYTDPLALADIGVVTTVGDAGRALVVGSCCKPHGLPATSCLLPQADAPCAIAALLLY